MQAIVNRFVFLGQQWLSSLKFFLPKNFKLFSLVTINAWWHGVKSFFKYFWWLFFVFLFFQSHEFHHLIYELLKILLPENNFLVQFFQKTGTMLGFVQFASKTILYHVHFFGVSFRPWVFFECLPFFFMFLAIRPSVKQKNYHYYFSYILQYIFFIFFLIVIGQIIWFFFSFIRPNLQLLLMKIIFLYPAPLETEMIRYSPIGIFAAYFYLDSNGSFINSIKCWWRGLKMVFYNYPFLIITMITMYIFLMEIFPRIPFIDVFFFIKYVGPILGLFVTWLAYILFAAIFNNFYLKRVHENYELYF
jgi:hypothetical protein